MLKHAPEVDTMVTNGQLMPYFRPYNIKHVKRYTKLYDNLSTTLQSQPEGCVVSAENGWLRIPQNESAIVYLDKGDKGRKL
jgi:myo-inositol-hexaphosphate 3-phosphohydrolase